MVLIFGLLPTCILVAASQVIKVCVVCLPYLLVHYSGRKEG